MQPPPLAWRCNKYTCFALVFFLRTVLLFFLPLFSHFFDHRRNCHLVAVAVVVAGPRCCCCPLPSLGCPPISHEHVNVYTRTAILCLRCPHPHANPSPPQPRRIVSPISKVIYELSSRLTVRPTNDVLSLSCRRSPTIGAEPSASRQWQAEISRSSPVSLVASSRDRVRQLHLICRPSSESRVCEQEKKNRKRDS